MHAVDIEAMENENGLGRQCGARREVNAGERSMNPQRKQGIRF